VRSTYFLVLFPGSWVGQSFAQLSGFRTEQQTQKGPFMWSDFMTQFLASTFENWQSEWLQLIVQGILLLGAKHSLFQVDAEDMERMENKVHRIAE
jgi:hypothetical protein